MRTTLFLIWVSSAEYKSVRVVNTTLTRDRSIRLRNRIGINGRQDIENRLRGCWIQLLTILDDTAIAPVWQKQITYGAPSYYWELQ